MSRSAKQVYASYRKSIDKNLTDIRDGLRSHGASTIHWGHVGDVAHWAELLTEVADAINRRGEYGEVDQ